MFADSCRLAHLPVKLEVGNNLTPDHDHSRPADVLVHNWSLGKPAAFDFCVTSPLNSLILSEAGVSSGVAAQASEIRKHNSNHCATAFSMQSCAESAYQPYADGYH